MNKKVYETRGTHIIVDAWDINLEVLNDLRYLSDIFKKAIEVCGATIVGYSEKQFEPCGCSFVYLLSESHLSAHTYVREGYLSFDFYVCGSVDPNVAVDFIINALKPRGDVYRQSVVRGVR